MAPQQPKDRLYDTRYYFGHPGAAGMSPYEASLYLFSKLYEDITEKQRDFCLNWTGSRRMTTPETALRP